MELRPGYKQTEVGVIPEEWDCTLLGAAVTKVGSGLTPTGGATVYKSFGRPFLRSQNVGWGTLDLDDIAYIDDATHSRFPDTELKNSDVLLNITGASIGRSAVADDRLPGGNVNQHVCIIRPIADRLEPHFLCAFLLSTVGQKQIDSFQAGGNRQGLNFKQIRSFVVPLPPLPEQRAIAAALSDVDAQLAALDALLAKQRALKQAAMQQLLTGRTRLAGFGSEWTEYPFGRIVAIRVERIDLAWAGEQSFCVELEHIGQGTGSLTGHTIARVGASQKVRFMPGDVLFGKLRAYLRKFWLADREGVCSTEIWPLVSDSLLLVPGFLFQLVQTDGFIEVASTAFGTHMPRSDWRVVKNYPIHVPPVDEQRAIAAVLSDMDAEIATLDARISKTRLLKQAMMQELLTGRIRLV